MERATQPDTPPVCELTAADQAWLATFGVDPSWQDDEAVRTHIKEIIGLGSIRLDEPGNESRRQEVVAARDQFLRFIGLEDHTIEAAYRRYPTLFPISTFIDSQRAMYAAQLNAPKIVKVYPAALHAASTSITNTVANFEGLGLNPTKIINTLPSAIGYAEDSVRAKVANLKSLGLNPAKVANTFPSVIGCAPESVRQKMDLLERGVAMLQWQCSAQELVEFLPAVLGFKAKKIDVLMNIAARHITPDSRSATPEAVKSALITPLEQYIIVLGEQDSDGENSMSMQELHARARKHKKLEPGERREKALDIARTGKLGRIGILYLEYRDVPLPADAA